MRKNIMNTLKIVSLILALSPYLTQAADDSKRPPRGDRMPPKEAFEACKGKTTGDSVEVNTPHGKIKATCKSMAEILVAIPIDKNHPLPKEAFEDCKGKSEGTVLEVSTPNGKQSATCKTVDGQLAAILNDEQLPK